MNRWREPDFRALVATVAIAALGSACDSCCSDRACLAPALDVKQAASGAPELFLVRHSLFPRIVTTESKQYNSIAHLFRAGGGINPVFFSAREELDEDKEPAAQIDMGTFTMFQNSPSNLTAFIHSNPAGVEKWITDSPFPGLAGSPTSWRVRYDATQCYDKPGLYPNDQIDRFFLCTPRSFVTPTLRNVTVTSLTSTSVPHVSGNFEAAFKLSIGSTDFGSVWVSLNTLTFLGREAWAWNNNALVATSNNNDVTWTFTPQGFLNYNDWWLVYGASPYGYRRLHLSAADTLPTNCQLTERCPVPPPTAP